MSLRAKAAIVGFGELPSVRTLEVVFEDVTPDWTLFKFKPA